MQKDKITKKRSTTMMDVAERAGVAIGTVSHVINGTATISDETKSKVDRAIRELGYKPNSFARSLRKNQSKMIGLLIPDLMDEFYCSISRSFIDFAYKKGYTVMLSSFQYSFEREKQEFDVLINRQVDAIVLFGGVNDEQFIDSFSEDSIPIILCDRRSKSQKFSAVEFDNEVALRQIVELLKKKGYTKLGYVSEPLEQTNLNDRFLGFKIGLFEQGLKFFPEYIFICEDLRLDKISNGYAFMKRLLEQYPKESLPDVFITTSDLIAIGLIGALNETGYHIPTDFGVVGFDNLSVSPFISPALTTVAQDSQMIAKVVWDVTCDTLEEKLDKAIQMKLKNEIIIRESC